MPKNTLKIIFILLSTSYLISLFFAPYPLQYLAKVAPIVILLWCCQQYLSSFGRWTFSVAIIASGCGDVLLNLPLEQSFLFGLGAFLIAQLIYAISFYRFKAHAKLSSKQWLLVTAVVIYSLAMAFYILPSTGELLIPVTAYLLVITLMGMSAISSNLNIKVTVGALTFVASDSILSLSIFKNPLPFSDQLVMLTYYAAQFLIIFGVIDSQNKHIDKEKR